MKARVPCGEKRVAHEPKRGNRESNNPLCSFLSNAGNPKMNNKVYNPSTSDRAGDRQSFPREEREAIYYSAIPLTKGTIGSTQGGSNLGFLREKNKACSYLLV